MSVKFSYLLSLVQQGLNPLRIAVLPLPLESLHALREVPSYNLIPLNLYHCHTHVVEELKSFLVRK